MDEIKIPRDYKPIEPVTQQIVLERVVKASVAAFWVWLALAGIALAASPVVAFWAAYDMDVIKGWVRFFWAAGL
jgi:hypothetical protein